MQTVQYSLNVNMFISFGHPTTLSRCSADQVRNERGRGAEEAEPGLHSKKGGGNSESLTVEPATVVTSLFVLLYRD